MFKDHISRAAFIAVLTAVSPALADDAAISRSLNDLSQQVQDQQKQIEKLQRELNDKQNAKESSATRPATSSAVAQKPTVVAPLEPGSLGTLRMSEIMHPENLGTVSQAQPPLPATAPTPSPNVAQAVAPTTNSSAAPAHVGEAPPVSNKAPEVQALASVGGVLTPYGRVVIEPFTQYTRSSVNTFAFQGVEYVPSFLIGTVTANQAARDMVVSGATMRVGVSDRMELEARVPYVWRQDSFTNTILNANSQLTTTTTSGSGLGDVELAGHYQINDGHEDWPFFIGNLRFKSDTGSSPYKVAYNSDGSARSLATGSGFMAVEPSLTAIYPSDPATLFANIGYIHSFSQDINRTIAGNAVGRVTPGDTVMGSFGMGVALNDRLSFTLGYEHDYVLPTETVLGGVSENSQPLQVGSALSGISYRVNDRTSVILSLAAGVTRDAPDAVVGLRVPVSLQVF